MAIAQIIDIKSTFSETTQSPFITNRGVAFNKENNVSNGFSLKTFGMSIALLGVSMSGAHLPSANDYLHQMMSPEPLIFFDNSSHTMIRKDFSFNIRSMEASEMKKTRRIVSADVVRVERRQHVISDINDISYDDALDLDMSKSVKRVVKANVYQKPYNGNINFIDSDFEVTP